MPVRGRPPGGGSTPPGAVDVRADASIVAGAVARRVVVQRPDKHPGGAGRAGSGGGVGSDQVAHLEPTPRSGSLAWARASGLWRLAAALLALQLLALFWWSWVLWRRYALAWDFATYHQAWVQIASGHLDPYSSLLQTRFWRNDGEFLLWPLALLGLLTHSSLVFLWLQDLALVAANLVCLRWMTETLAGLAGLGKRLTSVLGALGLLLLLVNPWQYWAVSFDWHLEPVTTLLALLTARALHQRRWRAMAVWAGLLLLAGAPAAVLLAGVGIGGVLSRGRRRAGALLTTVAVGWTLALSSMGGALGGGLTSAYGYLAGHHTGSVSTSTLLAHVLAHPLGVLRAWWPERLNGLAFVAAAGLLGAVAAPAAAVVLLVLLSSDLYGSPGSRELASVPFQNLAVGLFVSYGTVLLLGRALSRGRWRRPLLGLGAGLAGVAVVWSAVWLPAAPSASLRVSPSAAEALAAARAMVPPGAEVIAWQGVIGRFSDRGQLYPVLTPGTYPVSGRPVYVLAAPYAGIEVASVQQSLLALARLAGPLHAHLLLSRAGVWLWSWDPPPGATKLALSGGEGALPAWALNPGAGEAVLSGPPAGWHLASPGRPGYVASGDYQRLSPGAYLATAEVASTGPVSVEVWDDTDGKLLARRQLASTNGESAVQMAFRLDRLHPPRIYRGWGIWRLSPRSRAPGDQVEIRVYSPGSQVVDVYSLQLSSLPPGAGGSGL